MKYQELADEIRAWPKSQGVTISDLLTLREPLRGALNTTIREGSVPLQFFADSLSLDLDSAVTLVDLLLDHGFLKVAQTAEDGRVEYRVWHAQAHRRSQGLDIFARLSEPKSQDPG